MKNLCNNRLILHKGVQQLNNLKVFKFATISLVVLLFLTVFPQIAYANTGNYTYDKTENGILITGYNGEDTNLTIPQEIDGQIVVGIGNNAFSSNTTLINIVIPDGVTYIEDNAFSNCSNLSIARFMGDAPTIGKQVFSNCSPKFVIYYDPGKNGFNNEWNGFTTETYTSESETSAVTGISLDKTSATLMVGESLSLLPSINPSEATNKNVSWTSSNTDVITVDTSGVIKAVSIGNAIITATTEDGGFTAACSVNVSNLLAIPSNELAVPQDFNTINVSWSTISDATGYEVYRSNAINGEYLKVATVQSRIFNDTGLQTGTVYYYKVRSYKTINDTTICSDFTQIITVKTLDKSIGSTLFLYMSNLNNRNSVLARAVALHNGVTSNNCAYMVSEALRRLGIGIPTDISMTNQVESHLIARGWKREMNLNLLQPGDICFTTDQYGNLLGGHSTHVFIFMGWANKEKTLMNICDNQTGRYGSVFHTRSIYNTSITDATAFFYHTNLPSVSLILKIPTTVNVIPSTYNKVNISWDVATSTYAYKIYRSSSKYGTYYTIATTRNTNYIDSTVTTGRTYYYKVRAYNYIGTSVIYGSYSDVSTATPALSVPLATINSIYQGKGKLTWNGVSGANGYQIYRSTIKNGTYTRIATTTSTSYINSGLISGRNYYYKVRAYRYVASTKVYSIYSYINLMAI